MTETLTGLRLIADGDHPQRETVLADFAERWRAEPLVLDKWLWVQAVSRRSDSLTRVQALMAHSAFSLANPNRVRALIGAFASANPRNFHALDGAGYAFLSAQVQALDARNPQVAARLARSFARWRHFDPERAAAMRAALEAISGREGISRDLAEVTARMLGRNA
jgi:aminopeptidase N